jgi:hypothetical protein
MLLGISTVILIGCVLIGYGLAVEKARRGLVSWGWPEPPDAVISYLSLAAGALLVIVGTVAMCVLEILLGLLSIMVAYPVISLSALFLTLLIKRSSDRRRRQVDRRTD